MRQLSAARFNEESVEILFREISQPFFPVAAPDDGTAVREIFFPLSDIEYAFVDAA